MGTIVHMDNKNKSGVIEDENAQDIIFEFRHLKATVKEYDQVSFEIILDKDGLRAINISKR